MKVGYFGDGPWAHLALQHLLQDSGFQIVFVCARYDEQDPVLRQMADSAGLPFLCLPDVNSDQALEVIEVFGSDILVSMSFNQIFRERIINLARMGIINCHAGMLPFYRGRNVLNWALINDEPYFGITVHYVDASIDTGDIIAQQKFPISDEDDFGTVSSRAHIGCAEVLVSALEQLRDGDVEPIKQESIHPVGFYCTRRGPGDELIDWTQSSREIFNFVRALAIPGPQARSMLDGTEVRIQRVECIKEAPAYKGICGAVLAVEDSSFFVKTGDSFVKVVAWESDIAIKVGGRFSCARS